MKMLAIDEPSDDKSFCFILAKERQEDEIINDFKKKKTRKLKKAVTSMLSDS